MMVATADEFGDVGEVKDAGDAACSDARDRLCSDEVACGIKGVRRDTDAFRNVSSLEE